MSPLWSDIALARAARAKADDLQWAGGKVEPAEGTRPSAIRRPVRRVLLPRRESFAL